ncbi:MAG: photosynthetic reaction center cytochrome c subunit family protein, partial [Myxococcota bacterium]
VSAVDPERVGHVHHQTVGEGEYALSQYYPEYRLGSEGDNPKVNCYTCHQGAFKPVLGRDMITNYPMLAKYDPYVPPTETAPKVEIKGDHIDFSGKVFFETGSAKISERSLPLLDAVAKVMNDNPRVKKVEIQGHTDNTGGAAENLALSDARAIQVMTYIISDGVAPERLSAKGYGQTQPVGDNSTDEGRDANRRVEFLITDMDEEEAQQ